MPTLNGNPLGYADVNAGANSAKGIKITIIGDSSQLGAATKQAVGQLNELKGAAMSLMAGFTGGLIGGGVGGAVQAVVNIVSSKIREARMLLEDADRLNVDVGSARGIRDLGSATGVDVAGTVQATRTARAEALAGDPNFTKAFERLGISLQSIKDVDPATLFYRMVDAMEKFDVSAEDAKENFAALSLILGSRRDASDLTAFAKGGLFREKRLFGDNGDLMAALLADNPKIRAQFKQDFEPPGAYGVGDQVKAARMDEDLRQRRLSIARSEMSVEERIKSIVEERANLEKQIAETKDVVKQRRLEGDVLSLDEEMARLRATGGQSRKSMSFQRDADEFARKGLYIGGGQGVSLQEQQVQRLTGIEQGIRQLLATTNQKW